VNERRALDSRQARIMKDLEAVRLSIGGELQGVCRLTSVTPEAVADNLKQLREKVHHLDDRLMQRFAAEQVADDVMAAAGLPSDDDAEVQEQLNTIEIFHDLQANEPASREYSQVDTDRSFG
jgi:hypothetical protein